MCGIAGIISEQAVHYTDHLGKMVSALRHRGPDGNGTHNFESCLLGHTRLAIIDLNNGQQPMLTQNNQLGITFNGEIYGYKELIAEYSDYAFKTSSDTEVILALYQKQGPDMIKKLPGMFAFGIWDDQAKELFCARDRFGEKPLYYATGANNTFIFASEIKAILSSGLITPRLDKGSIAHYLKKLYVHPTKTIYSNIHTLPPGCSLIFKNNQVSVSRYWSVPDENREINLNEASEQFTYLFEKAVNKQIVADVPVSAFLSGGLDSSTIVAIASQSYPQLKTFSFGFEGDNSELPYAKQIADRYQTDHTEIQADDFDIADLLMEMQQVYDEPFGDSSNIPTYLICKLARQHTKVVLTGDGGDELLAGYSWYEPLYRMENFKSDTSWYKYNLFITKTLSKLGLKNQSRRFQKKAYNAQMLGKYSSIIDAHSDLNTHFDDSEISNLLGKRSVGNFDTHDYDFTRTDSVNDAIKVDVLNYMPGDILVKIDRASMAHGLELRSPFLDHELADFCLSLSSNLKMSEKQTKIILRKCYEDKWTEQIRSRAKQGFGADTDRWLEDKRVAELKNTYLKDPTKNIYSIIDYDQCMQYFDANSYKTWMLLVLSLWMEQHSFEIN